jgi:hypothetical protein
MAAWSDGSIDPIAASNALCSSASLWLVFGGARCRWLEAR